jgi:RNA recognition motif-containing protein
MSTTLYVTNLSPQAARDEIELLFAAHGTVRSVAVINQFTTADSKGVAFVEMDSERHGEAAMAALNGTPHRDSALTVSWAVPGAGLRRPR